MSFFKKKPDAMSLTMALVEAFARGDEAAIDVARNKLASIETRDIFHSLYKFGQVLNLANINLERSAAVIERGLNVEGKTSEMTAAIMHVGRANPPRTHPSRRVRSAEHSRSPAAGLDERSAPSAGTGPGRHHR